MFAASVGNVDWLRFCLNREHREVIADDKVKHVAWRQPQHPRKSYAFGPNYPFIEAGARG